MEGYDERQTPQNAGRARPGAPRTEPAQRNARPEPHAGGTRAAASGSGASGSGKDRADIAARAQAIEQQLIRQRQTPQGQPENRRQMPDDAPRRSAPRPAAHSAGKARPEVGRNARGTGDARTGHAAPGRNAAPARNRPAPRSTRPAGGRHYAAQPRKKRRFRMSGGLFFASAAVVILSLAWVITALIEMPARRAEAASLAAASAASAAAAAPQPGENIGPVLPAGATYTPPSAALLAMPEAGRVDMSYFDDALFIGDSLTRGFQEYVSGIPNAKYAAYIGVGPRQFMEGLVQNRAGEQVAAIDEILAAAPKKVYILLGTNSMATLSDEAFLKYYTDFIDFLLPQLPADTVYYLQAIPPVTAAKFESDEQFSIERILGLNESLARLAYEKGLHFLDLYSALADDTGALRADIASGEIHLNDSGYSLWREFLVTHTAYQSDNPYLPGSPYYTAPGA